MKLLHVDASILGENSVGRQLSATVVARLREAAHLAAAQGAFAENVALEQDVASGRQRKTAIAAATAAARLAA